MKKVRNSAPNKEGDRFGRLVIVEEVGFDKWGHRIFLCKCDCGNIKTIGQSNLRNGATTSCGCYNAEETSKRSQKEPGVAGINHKFGEYRRSAIERKKDFNLTIDEFKFIIFQNCYFCKSSPKPFNCYITSKGKTTGGMAKEKALLATIYVNGIDRLDNNIGYTVDNCVPCCTICNIMKKALSKEEFLAHIHQIAQAHPPTSS